MIRYLTLEEVLELHRRPSEDVTPCPFWITSTPR